IAGGGQSVNHLLQSAEGGLDVAESSPMADRPIDEANIVADPERGPDLVEDARRGFAVYMDVEGRVWRIDRIDEAGHLFGQLVCEDDVGNLHRTNSTVDRARPEGGLHELGA